ncbi:hypothetical protein [Rhodococcus qingshengii]|uniref:hypothetical protein n=1 Tax=Rhodococcus qingshengii TaxID=334542 RepID=UPI001F2DAA6E|nr:hypothetical protein [Rhodococcus qingshengii]
MRLSAGGEHRCRDHAAQVWEQVSEYAALMRVTRQSTQRDFTDERLISFAQSLALSLSDEAPGADLIEFERAISMPVAAIGLSTAALAEASKVAHINLDDKEAVAGLSLLSTLGMICADASASLVLVPVPPPTAAAHRRYLDGAATSITEGAKLPDGLDETNRQHFADILARDADGVRALTKHRRRHPRPVAHPQPSGAVDHRRAPPTAGRGIRTRRRPSSTSRQPSNVETSTHPVRISANALHNHRHRTDARKTSPRRHPRTRLPRPTEQHHRHPIHRQPFRL